MDSQGLKISIVLPGPPDKDKVQALLTITEVVDLIPGAEICVMTKAKAKDGE